jgi:hypothetical protein
MSISKNISIHYTTSSVIIFRPMMKYRLIYVIIWVHNVYRCNLCYFAKEKYYNNSSLKTDNKDGVFNYKIISSIYETCEFCVNEPYEDTNYVIFKADEETHCSLTKK